mgnify:CR=1 FL=1
MAGRTPRDDARDDFIDQKRPAVKGLGGPAVPTQVGPRTETTSSAWGAPTTTSRQILDVQPTVDKFEFQVKKDGVANGVITKNGYARIAMQLTTGDGKKIEGTADIMRNPADAKKHGVPGVDNAAYIMKIAHKGPDGQITTSIFPVNVDPRPGHKDGPSYTPDYSGGVHFKGTDKTGTREAAPSPAVSSFARVLGPEVVNKAVKNDQFVMGPSAPKV